MQRVPDEEDARYEAGDLDAAVELNLRAVEAMAQGEPGPSEPLDPPAGAWVREVRAPTLVVVGDADIPDMLGISERLEQALRARGGSSCPGSRTW